jgi:class I lanthipeptide synthase
MTTNTQKHNTKRGHQHNLYGPLSFAVVRAPALPVEFYRQMSQSSMDEETQRDFLADPRIRLAIQSASPPLLNALLSPPKSLKDRLRARRKFRRYLTRMSTRPTPFGAFAAVGLAPLGDQTSLRLDETRTRHAKRLDMPWLLEFVYRVESDPAIFRQLSLQADRCALTRGGRVHLRELSSLAGNGHSGRNASLKASHLVTRTLAAARSLTPYDRLAAFLRTSPQATEEKIQAFISDLWRQGFLLTDLRPPLTDGNPARYVLQRLESIPGADPYRLTLQRELAATESETLSSAKQPSLGTNGGPRTFVDSLLCPSGDLNVMVAHEAARAAEMLLSLTPWPSGPPHIRQYRRSFEDRYGVDREVPLLELLDPEYGIGLPPGYDGNENTSIRETAAGARVRREALFEIAQLANETRQFEVELDEETQRQLRTWIPSSESAPVSLEINVFVAARSMQDLDEGRFTLAVGPNVGAMECGRSLGRFAALMGSNGRNAFRQAMHASETVQPERQFVELSYLPKTHVLSNVMVRPRCREFEINYGVQPGVAAAQSIPMDDLLVGIREGRFYVRSPRFANDLKICSGHMANPQFAPSVCRLLAEIGMDGLAVLREFDWGMASMFHFLPRVRIGRVVLSLARWRISAVTARNKFHPEDTQAFRNSLSTWRSNWNAPRHVHLAESDNRLVLDLDNEMDIEDLRLELSRLSGNQTIMLEEIYPSFDEAWLRGSTGCFVGEYVVPLVLKSERQFAPMSSPPIPVKNTKDAPALATSGRVKAPGSEWLYAKLYCPPSMVDDLLGGPIRELTRSGQHSAIFDRWFFIRYADPDPHIRLRFQGMPALLSESLQPKLTEWAQSLLAADLCLRFAIDTYDREIERYGGQFGMERAEDFFCLDSETVLALLPFPGAQCPLRRVEMAVLSLDFILKQFGLSTLQRLSLLADVSGPRSESGQAYRERKAVMQALFGIGSDPQEGKTIRHILCVLEEHAGAISDVGRQLTNLEAEGKLTRPLEAILRAFAHMHCNRMGLDSATETLAYGLLTRSYYALHASAAHRDVALAS